MCFDLFVVHAALPRITHILLQQCVLLEVGLNLFYVWRDMIVFMLVPYCLK